MEIVTEPGKIVIKPDVLWMSNRRAYEIINPQLSEILSNGKKYKASVTFNYLRAADRSFWEIILFRRPVETKEFTTSNLYSIGNFDPPDATETELSEAQLCLEVTEEDESKFLFDKPIDKYGDIIFGSSLIGNEQMIACAIFVGYNDIVSITFTEI